MRLIRFSLFLLFLCLCLNLGLIGGAYSMQPTNPCSESLKNRKFSLPQQIVRDRLGNEYSLKDAQPEDVKPVMHLIHKAFKLWTDQGVHVSPSHQSEETTKSHLLGKGFTLQTSSGSIIGTFSLDEGRLESLESSVLNFYEGDDEPYPFTNLTQNSFKKFEFPLLVFKKLAIDPDSGKNGLGLALYQLAENYALTHQYKGLVLETVKEAKWLYEWYLSMGYSVIGKYKYPGSSLETLLLIKLL